MLSFIEKALAARPKPKKTGVSVVHIKKLVATVQNMGKSVTRISAGPDGTVTVSIGELSSAGEAGANPWDEVLP